MSKRLLALFLTVGMIAGFTSGPANAAVINGAFACSGGGTFTVEDNVLLEESGYSCVGLADIPNGVTEIESYAFYDAEELTSVLIPASVNLIGETSFLYTYELTEFIVDPGNYSFKAEEGVLFSKNGGTLICFPSAKNKPYNIPENVTAIGDSAFDGVGLTSITIPTGVTSIGNVAFANNSLTSITIPAKVTSIGAGAFSYNSIAQYTVEAGNTAFKSEDGILFTKNGDTLLNYPSTKAGPYSIPVGVTTISSGAFQNSTGLTSITIPTSVTTIEGFAFSDARFISSITFAPNSELKVIGEYAFHRLRLITEITIPASVTSIGNYAFRDLSSLKFLTFAENSQLTSIGNSGFSDLTSLESVTIPASVTSLGRFAFYGATSLTSLTFAENSQLIAIGFGAFQSAKALTSVTFAENSQLTTIGGQAFTLATSLASITIPASVTSIGESAFANDYRIVNALTTVTFAPNSQLTSIGKGAFKFTNSLTQIEIPASVTAIGENAFLAMPFGRNSLSSVTFQSASQLTTIGEGAFKNQRSLGSITIPASVTSIGKNAFGGSLSLSSLTFESGSQLRSIGESAFENAPLLTSITIPASVTTIGITAFKFTVALSSLSFESGSALQSIGAGAFDSAGELSTLTIPASVTSIGSRAFLNLKSDSTVYFLGNAPTDIVANSFVSGVNAYVTNCSTGFAADGDGNWFGLKLNLSPISSPCLVIYNLNGGFGVASAALGENVVVTEPTEPSRPGYDFVGWSDTDGGELVGFPYYPGSSAANITLYADWTPSTHVVTYDSNGGSEVADGSFVTDGSIASAPTPPNWDGYKFIGWADYPEPTSRDDLIEFPYYPGVVSAITLYAFWRVDSGAQTPTPGGENPVQSPTTTAPAAPIANNPPAPAITTSMPKFQPGSGSLTKAGKATLKEIVKNSGADAAYTITGAASKSIGVPSRFVKALAKSRAEKVKAYLIKLGVKESNITIKIKITESGVTPKTKIKIA